MSIKLEIPKDAILDGTNYTDWKMIVESVLEQHELTDVVMACKDNNDPIAARITKTFLLFSMNREHRNKINHCKTASEIWSAISNIYENKSKRAINTLWKRLFNYKIASAADISSSISEMQTIVSSLRSRDIKVDESCLIGCIECALPEEFNDWVINWNMRDSEPTLNELINNLNNYVETLKTTEAKAMAATAHRNQHNSKPKDDRKTCKYCKLSGHDVSECRKLLRKKAEEAAKTTSNNDSSKPKTAEFAMMATISDGSSSSWLADSGASLHMTHNLSWLHNYRKIISPINIRLGDDRIIQALGFGDIKTPEGTLKSVHYVPELKTNLLSIPAATKQGTQVLTTEKFMSFRQNDREVALAYRKGDAYWLNFKVIEPSQHFCAAATLEDWHKRFGHVSSEVVERMQKSNAVLGMEISQTQSKTCEDCATNKCHAASHPTRSTPKATKPGIVLHVDTVGPIRPTGVGNTRFLLVCKDEYSGFRITRPLKAKSQIPEEVQKIISLAELDTGNRVLKIRSDHGTEFLSERLTNFMDEHGIIHELSSKYTPQQNGTIEREIRTITEASRTLINAANLPHTLWPEAASTATYVLNRSLKSKGSATPYELWHGTKPNVKNFKIFGQHAIVLKNKATSKFETKGEKLIFVGYTSHFNTYKFFDPSKDQIVTNCNVRFLNTSGPLQLDNINSQPDEPISFEFSQEAPTMYENINPRTSTPIIPETTHIENQTQIPPEPNVVNTMGNNSEMQKDDTLTATEITPVNPRDSSLEAPNDEQSQYLDTTASTLPNTDEPIYVNHGEPPTNSRTKGRIDYKVLNSIGKLIHHAKVCELITSPTIENHHRTVQDLADPNTFKQATGRPDSENWLEAMNDELNSLERCQVWELVDRPETNVVSCRWVFKTKRSPSNEIIRYRARLVARGFTQEKGRDYFETYAPVCDTSAIRLLFAYAAHQQLIIKQFDIKTAFLYGDLNEVVYLEQPPGFETDRSKVYRLKKALYGLKQASKQWNLKFSSFLIKIGFKQMLNDQCIFMQESPLIVIAVYVDDAIVLSKEQSMIDLLLKRLQSQFDVHEINSNIFLGFQYTRDSDGGISIHQQRYVEKIIEQYNMTDANPTTTPELTDENDRNDYPDADEGTPYREAVGSIMYAAVTTRIDIAHAASRVAQVSKPTVKDWTAIKRILRYLKGTKELGITYPSKRDGKLSVFCDSNYAGDQKKFKSTSGYIIMYSGAPILWRSKKQEITTTSSTEAEFVSLCTATKDTTWIRNLALELKIIDNEPVMIHCDNTSTIKIAANEQAAKRTRHLGAQIHYPKEQADKGIIQVSFVPSQEQRADMLTKPLGPQKFIPNRNWLMNTLAMMTLICCMTSNNQVQSQRFQTVPPIIYAPTAYFVEESLIEYDIDFTYISPCDSISNPEGGFWKQFSNQYHEWENTKKLCEKLYNEEWMPEINELMKLHSRPNHHIFKRGVISNIAWGAAGLVLGQTTTNLLKPVFRFIGIRDPLEDRTDDIEDQLTKESQRIKTFEKNFNLTRHINQELVNGLKDLSAAVENNHREIQRLAQQQPTLSWFLTYLQNRIIKTSGLLDAVNSKYNQGFVATRQLSELLNLTELHDIDEKDTIMRRVILKGERTITFRFAIRTRSQDSGIYKMITFKHWTRLESIPELVEYDGLEYAIYNRSSNCIKGIESPNDRFVIDDCSEPNYVDDRLNNWRSLTLDKTKSAPYPVPKIRSTPNSNYIYCFKNNITIQGETRPCPPEVFKLRANIPFSTGKFTFRVDRRKLAINQNTPDLIDQIHPAHFTGPIVDTDKLLKILDELKKYDTQGEVEVWTPKKHRYVSWGLGGASVITSILVVIYLLSRFKTLRREVIYETIGLSTRNVQPPKRPSHEPPPPPRN